MDTPKYSLEDIYLFPQDYINKFLILNNRQPFDYLTDRLITTILFHNGALLLETDEKYVTDPIFNLLYLFSDQELKSIAENNDIAIADRIKMIRALIHKFDAYDQKTVQKKLEEVAGKGDVNTVKIIVLKFKFKLDYNEAMERAARDGHKYIIQLMLQKGADNYNYAMTSAALGGQMEIVELMLEKGANNYNWTMVFAALGGQKEMVQLMLDLGADDYNGAMDFAAFGGHKEIVQLMLDLGVGDQRSQLLDPEEVSRADNYDEAIKSAREGDHDDIVKLIQTYKKKATNKK